MLTIRWCAECAAETEFVTFDCADHGADCVELACCGCGCGIEVAPLAVTAAPGQTWAAA